MSFDDDKLIYLDVEFISRKYEQIKKVNPSTTFTAQKGGEAAIGAGFANAGVSTQESRSYSTTSRTMASELWLDLQKRYPEFQTFENYTGTRLLWMKGKLTLAEWADREKKRPGYEFFQLNHENDERTALLADQAYFAAGFSSILSASMALKGNVGIPVRILARMMWHVDDARNYVACPYIIVEA